MVATNPVTPTRIPKASAPRVEMYPYTETELEAFYRRAAARNQRLADLVLKLPSQSHIRRVELRGLEPLTFSLRTRRATDCAIAPRIGVGRSAPRLYHRQAEATFGDSPPASAVGESVADSGASAVTGPSCRAEEDIPGPERSIVRTVRGASGFET
jgi:hypothetical protein